MPAGSLASPHSPAMTHHDRHCHFYFQYTITMSKQLWEAKKRHCRHQSRGWSVRANYQLSTKRGTLVGYDDLCIRFLSYRGRIFAKWIKSCYLVLFKSYTECMMKDEKDKEWRMKNEEWWSIWSEYLITFKQSSTWNIWEEYWARDKP